MINYMQSNHKPVLVVGGGISGITTAIEIAEVGHQVVLVEKNPYLGGQVARMNNYFPKLCPPSCGLEINFRRIKNNHNITVCTDTTVKHIEGTKGNFKVTLLHGEKLINDNCTACGECAKVCPVDRSNDFNYHLDSTKAAYLPHEMAFPMKYHIDSSVCEKTACGKCEDVCKYDAIHLSAQKSEEILEVSSVVYATGWVASPKSNLEKYKYVDNNQVITNVEMERYLASNGPTGGKVRINGNNEEPADVAFVQCAGSRDENYLPYCSGVCCSASLKQALSYAERNPKARISIFYIDLRVTGRNEDFLKKVEKHENVELVKGKVAKVEKDSNGRIQIQAEDIMQNKKIAKSVDLVVLAAGIVPAGTGNKEVETDEYGFVCQDNLPDGIFAVGCTKNPMDVSASLKDATGAAIKAIQIQ
jgi:quinone-modifying oxidoreductase, subunit QmoA